MAKVQTKHKATPFIIADFETGGRSPSENPLTEIAMIAIEGDSLKEIGRYESLIWYADETLVDYTYEDEALLKTGLTLAKLKKEGKRIDAVAAEVLAFFQLANVHKSKTGYKPVIIAHNAAFEQACFQHMMCITKNQDEFSKNLHGMNDFHGNFVPAAIDTLLIAKMLWAANLRMKSYALESVCERAAIEISDGHRAMNDVIATKEVFVSSIKMLREADSGVKQGGNVDGELSFRSGFHFEF